MTVISLQWALQGKHCLGTSVWGLRENPFRDSLHGKNPPLPFSLGWKKMDNGSETEGRRRMQLDFPWETQPARYLTTTPNSLASSPPPPSPPLPALRGLTLLWTYTAETGKHLPAGECCLHGTHSTFPEVGRCGCARSRHAFYTRTSGS